MFIPLNSKDKENFYKRWKPCRIRCIMHSIHDFKFLPFENKHWIRISNPSHSQYGYFDKIYIYVYELYSIILFYTRIQIWLCIWTYCVFHNFVCRSLKAFIYTYFNMHVNYPFIVLQKKKKCENELKSFLIYRDL